MIEDRRKRGPNRRLDTWKEIASYFGRDERTVKRWEKDRGLPVLRLPGPHGSVYAFSDDLAQWMSTRSESRSKTERDESPGNQPQLFQPATEATSVANPINLPGPRAVTPATAVQTSQKKISIGTRSGWVLGLGLLVLSTSGLAVLYHRRALALIAESGQAGTHAATSSHVPTKQVQDLYLRGRYHWNKRTPADLKKALEYFRQATSIDPRYALAYVGMADCYNLLREFAAMPESEAYSRAIAAASTAIELDGNLAEAHNSLAFDMFYWSLDAAGAEREFRRALELNPNYALAHHWYATFLMALGRSREAVEQIEIAQRLDSSSTSTLADKGLILYYAGRPKEAVALLDQVAESEPEFLSTHRYLAFIHLLNGNFGKYLEEARKAALLSRDDTELAIVEAGEKELHAGASRNILRAILSEEKRLYSESRISPYRLAETSALLGDKQEALTYLRAACDRHDLALAGILADPPFNVLHGDAAYRDLVSQVGLPPPVGS
jgi:tetratricopeptide (TPR) repeat protein